MGFLLARWVGNGFTKVGSLYTAGCLIVRVWVFVSGFLLDFGYLATSFLSTPTSSTFHLLSTRPRDHETMILGLQGASEVGACDCCAVACGFCGRNAFVLNHSCTYSYSRVICS